MGKPRMTNYGQYFLFNCGFALTSNIVFLWCGIVFGGRLQVLLAD